VVAPAAALIISAGVRRTGPACRGRCCRAPR
jgi:hypothetical protein